MPWENFEASPWETPSYNMPSGSPRTPTSPNWWDRNQDWVLEAANAAATLAGGVYSNRQNRKAEERAAALQKEFAQNGIRWRVEDAKAAGLHPLYALNGQLPQFSPAFSTDAVGPAIGAAGQNISRALQAGFTPDERRLHELQLKLLESQIGATDAQAMAARSEAFRNMQDANASIPIPLSDGSGGSLGETLSPEGIAIMGQHVNKAPNSFMPSELDASVGANVNPLWSRFMLGKGREMVLPGGISGDAAEALESLAESPTLMYITYRENVARYPGFEQFILDRYGPPGGSRTASDAWQAFLSFIRGATGGAGVVP